MKLVYQTNAAIEVQLSRSNLEQLLRSLNGGSYETKLLRHDDRQVIIVTAVEDAEHYAERREVGYE